MTWYITHHYLQNHGKNPVVDNYSFQYKGHNPNEPFLPDPTLGASSLPVLLHLREYYPALSSGILVNFQRVQQLPKDRLILQFCWRDQKLKAHQTLTDRYDLPCCTCGTFADMCETVASNAGCY